MYISSKSRDLAITTPHIRAVKDTPLMMAEGGEGRGGGGCHRKGGERVRGRGREAGRQGGREAGAYDEPSHTTAYVSIRQHTSVYVSV